MKALKMEFRDAEFHPQIELSQKPPVLRHEDLAGPPFSFFNRHLGEPFASDARLIQVLAMFMSPDF